MNLDNIYRKVAFDLNLDSKEVKKAYEYFWEFVKKTAQEFPDLYKASYEEFEKLRKSFHITHLGTFSIEKGAFIKRQQLRHAKIEKRKANIKPRVGDSGQV